jgi:hypothetical protein
VHFADAPEKFQDALARIEAKVVDADLTRAARYERTQKPEWLASMAETPRDGAGAQSQH